MVDFYVLLLTVCGSLLIVLNAFFNGDWTTAALGILIFLGCIMHIDIVQKDE